MFITLHSRSKIFAPKRTFQSGNGLSLLLSSWWEHFYYPGALSLGIGFLLDRTRRLFFFDNGSLRKALAASSQAVFVWEIIDCVFRFFLYKLSGEYQYLCVGLACGVIGYITRYDESFLWSRGGERYRNIADNVFWLYFYYLTYMCNHLLAVPLFLMLRKHPGLKGLFYRAFMGALVWAMGDFIVGPLFHGGAYIYHHLFGTGLFFVICMVSYVKDEGMAD